MDKQTESEEEYELEKVFAIYPRMESVATTENISFNLYFVLKEDVLLKSRVWENCKHGSVRGIETIGGF